MKIKKLKKKNFRFRLYDLRGPFKKKKLIWGMTKTHKNKITVQYSYSQSNGILTLEKDGQTLSRQMINSEEDFTEALEAVEKIILKAKN